MFTLDQFVPWGRSFDEYRRMFALTDEDLRLKRSGVVTARRASMPWPHGADQFALPLLEDVPYEFQRGANQMMRIRRDLEPIERASRDEFGRRGEGLPPVGAVRAAISPTMSSSTPS
jgi:hypothetical protein